MVDYAIRELNEADGSSIKAICNFISNHFNVDGKTKRYFIKRYIMKSVASGEIQQISGRGAVGKFKIAGELIILIN